MIIAQARNRAPESNATIESRFDTTTQERQACSTLRQRNVPNSSAHADGRTETISLRRICGGVYYSSAHASFGGGLCEDHVRMNRPSPLLQWARLMKATGVLDRSQMRFPISFGQHGRMV